MAPYQFIRKGSQEREAVAHAVISLGMCTLLTPSSSFVNLTIATNQETVTNIGVAYSKEILYQNAVLHVYD